MLIQRADIQQKGFKEARASHTFKRKFGHFPHSKKVFPVATSKEVMGFIQHCNISRAKSYNMKELRI